MMEKMKFGWVGLIEHRDSVTGAGHFALANFPSLRALADGSKCCEGAQTG